MLNRIGTSELLLSVTLLAAAGLVMVYSASAMRSEVIFGSSSVYLWRQLGGLSIGLIAAVLAARLPLEWIRRSGYAAWAATVLCLAATLTSAGVEHNGASRWLAIGDIAFQPLEFAKLGLVLALAQWLAARQDRMGDSRVSVALPLLLAGTPAVLLLLQPDFGGALMLLGFAAILVFLAGARLDHLAASALLATPVLATLALARGYRVGRLEAFLDPWADPVGRGYQLVQSLLAFGSGGLTGAGLGSGQQKLGYLPEAHTDFILSVVAEEAGLLGVCAVLLAFALFALASIAVALRARNSYAGLLAAGASLLIWLQAMLNAAVAMGMLPTTGATLPLFSYGRSSLIVSLTAVGLILNVARPSKRGRSGWRS